MYTDTAYASREESRSGVSRSGAVSKAKKRIVAMIATLACSVSVMVASPVEASAAPTGTVMIKTQRMSKPTLNSTQHGWYEKNSKLTLTCYERGQSVKGYYSPWIPGGWDNLWYKVSDGKWVADVDINTGTNDPVTKKCGEPQTTSKAQKAVNWSLSMVGSNAYDFLCEKFVENAYGTSGKYPSAIAAYNALKAAGKIQTKGTPPVGALVFSTSSYDQGYGHVVISVGNNTYVSGGMSKSYKGIKGGGSTVQLIGSANPASGAKYLGWAPAPSSWPGR